MVEVELTACVLVVTIVLVYVLVSVVTDVKMVTEVDVAVTVVVTKVTEAPACALVRVVPCAELVITGRRTCVFGKEYAVDAYSLHSRELLTA